MTEIATSEERNNLNEWLGVPSHDGLSACVSCGICLPKCPTFQILGVETTSPRGRAALVRSAADGRLPLGAGLEEHMYLCLNCQACHTACPNGVRVGEMVERTRAELRRNTPTPLFRRMIHRLVLGWLLGRHWRVELAAGLLRLYQRLGLGALVRRLGALGLLPAGLAAKEALLPILPRRFLRREIPLVTPAKGERRGAVGIFLGCIMNTLYADVTRATIRVLAENGYDVMVPKDQRCCGAPHLAEGEEEMAHDLMRHNVSLFAEYGVEAIVSDCAACGAETKKTALHLHGDSLQEEAARFSERAVDVNEFLARLPLRPPRGEVQARVCYHDACHLRHSQGIRDEPREILRAVPGLDLIEMKDSDTCCGSAGSYMITHPGVAGALLEDKMNSAAETGADIIAAANPGCLMQIGYGARRRGFSARVLHPIQLLAAAYRSEDKKNPE